MPTFPGFVGPAFAARNAAADYERCVGLYPEQNGPNAPQPWVLYSTPGLAVFGSVLPTSPIRGLWVGENRLFCVAGSKFYEINSSGAPINGLGGNADRGDVGNDGLPVQVFPNGNQVMIISAGRAYIDIGTALIQPFYSSASGTVNTAGTAVSLVWGDYFDNSMALNGILINGVLYTVASVTDPFNLVLFASAGTQSAVAFSVPISGTVATNGTAVTYNSGDLFDWTMTGQTINIDGTNYTVAQVTSTNTLVLTTSAGTHGAGSGDPVPYWILPPVSASCGAFLDGYFVVATPYTKQFNISALNNGLHWDPLDYAIKEGYPDSIVQMIADHEELYLLGSQTAEVWRNTGAADFPFQRDPGAFIHSGVGAKWSVDRSTVAQAIDWLGSDPEGMPIAYTAKGYVPTRISTHALEYRWGNFTTWTDAEGYTYVEDGHCFYVLTFPAAAETWVYDHTAAAWHQRCYGANPASLGRPRQRSYGYVWGKHVVGDYSTGQLYLQSTEYATDAGTAIARIRRAPHLTNDLKRTFYHQFILALAAGAFTTLTLSSSNDYGVNWSTPRSPDGARAADGVSTRIIGQRWNRLGSGRDRMFEIVLVATTAKVALLSAEIQIADGTS